MFSNLFNALVRKKIRVIRLFQLLWFIIGACFIAAARSINSPDPESYLYWYSIAVLSGQTGLIFFVITLLPGIFKRFGIRNRILGILMIFRRYLGISMFLFAAFHGLIVSLLPRLLNGTILALTTFELFGFTAVSLLFFLFLTSNDFSQMKLGKYWWLLHRLVYVIMWLILTHVALQRLSTWSVIAAVLVTAEMTGIIYSNIKLRMKS